MKLYTVRSKLLCTLFLIIQVCLPSGETLPTIGNEVHKETLLNLHQITTTAPNPENNHKQTSTPIPKFFPTKYFGLTTGDQETKVNNFTLPAEKQPATVKVHHNAIRKKKKKTEYVHTLYGNIHLVNSNQTKLSKGLKEENDLNIKGANKLNETLRLATVGNKTKVHETSRKHVKDDTLRQLIMEKLESEHKTRLDGKPRKPIVVTKIKTNNIIVTEKPEKSKDIRTQLTSTGNFENETTIPSESTTTPTNNKIELTTHPYYEEVEEESVYPTSNIRSRAKRYTPRHKIGQIPTRSIIRDGNFPIIRNPFRENTWDIWEDQGPSVEVYGKWKPPVHLRPPYVAPPPPPPDDLGSEHKDWMKPIRQAQEDAFYSSTPYPLRFPLSRKDWLLEVTAELLEDLNTNYISPDPIPQDPKSSSSIEDAKLYVGRKTIHVERVTAEEVGTYCPAANPCRAPRIYKPVCGTDERTYHNPKVYECAQLCNTSLNFHSWAPCRQSYQYTTTTSAPLPPPPEYHEYTQIDATNDTKAIIKLVLDRKKLSHLPGYEANLSDPLPDYIGNNPLLKWQNFVCTFFAFWCHAVKINSKENKPWQMLNTAPQRPPKDLYRYPTWLDATWPYKLRKMTFTKNYE